MTKAQTVEIFLSDPDKTTNVGQHLAAAVRRDDCILLSGNIGAGKTHLARALIQGWLAQQDLWEDVPSPTFTLVQTYSNGVDELWHADLYRLSSSQDVDELGLIDAIGAELTLIEWPDRLGDLEPERALRLNLSVSGEGRLLQASGPDHLIDAIRKLS